MRISRDYSKFCHNPEWYTFNTENHLFYPTKAAPKEIVTAIINFDVSHYNASKEFVKKIEKEFL